MKFLIISLAIFVATNASATTGCMLEMNGRWILDSEKSLDPEQLKYEVLVFNNTATTQYYFMEFQNSPTDNGSLEWSAPCDGEDHPSPEFPWSKDPNSTVAITRLGDNSEFVIQKESGILTTTYTRILADNLQTMISIGRDAQGKIIWVRVFNRED